MSNPLAGQKIKIVADNRKASFLYEIIEKYEAGISLYGPEIKSIKAGKANLSDGYVVIKDGEALLLNVHISPYEKANRENKDPLRTRVLLLHKHEILKLLGKIKEKKLNGSSSKNVFKSRHGKSRNSIGKRKKELRQKSFH